MKNTKLLPAVLLIGIAVSISYTTETQGVMSLTPPETTVSKEIPQQEAKIVLFAKVMEPAFAEDYINIDITTEVQFVATGKGSMCSHIINNYVEKKYIVFRAIPPGQSGEKNPLSGEVMAQYIMIPKDKSDSIFSAKTGDILTVFGRPTIEKMGDSKDVIFIATSAYKTGTETQHKAQTQPILENQPKTSQSSQQTQGDKKKTSVSTDISSDTAVRLERERALAQGVSKKQQKEIKRILAMDKSKRQQIVSLVSKAENAASKQDINSALQAYKEILEIDPDPDSLTAKHGIAMCEGIIAFHDKDYKSAIISFKKVLEINPDNLTAKQSIAMCEGIIAFHDKDYKSAIISYKKVLDIDPDSLTAKRGIAMCAFNDKDYKSVIISYKKVLDIAPEDFAANANIGGAYLGLHEFDLAFQYLNKATLINPERPEPYVNMSCAHAMKGDKDRAFRSLQKAVDRGYKNIEHIKNDTDLPEDFRNDPRLNNFIK